MCFKRILCRLLFTNTYRKATRQPITLLLQKAMALRSVEPFHTFMERSGDVIKFAESWRKQETPDELGSLVRSIYHLSKISGFQDVIESISNKEMDPSSKKSLLNGARKVARYFEVARFLCNLSKSILRSEDYVPYSSSRLRMPSKRRLQRYVLQLFHR